MGRILVALALALYNNVANLWPPFNRAAYVPANVTAATALLVVAATLLGLSRRELGLDGLSVADFLLGLTAGAAIAVPLIVLARTGRGSRLVADERVRGLRGGALAYQTLVRVPLGTALLEEVAFRGVLFAVWRDEGEATAYAVSSVVFGIWHVVPATTMVRMNAPRSGLVVPVAATVAFTALAGAALTWLRVETGSLAAPFALHATVNALATLAGAIAWRRRR